MGYSIIDTWNVPIAKATVPFLIRELRPKGSAAGENAGSARDDLRLTKRQVLRV